jgi:hypothetical protein
MYEIKLLHSDGYTVETIESGSTFLLPCDYTMSSFTDATGAPGIIKCLAPTGLTLTANPETICAGATVTLTASATGAASYSINGNDWYPSPVFEVTPGSNASYTLYAKTEEGCVAAVTDAAAVTVNPLPTGLSLTASPAAICEGQSATLTASMTPLSGASYSINNSTWQTTTAFTVKPTSTQTYTLYVKTAAGCTTTLPNVVTVAVNPLPTGLALTASPVAICDGQSATLTASMTPLSGASYSINNSTWQTTTAFTVKPTSTQTYTLYVKTAAGCTATLPNVVTVTVTLKGAAGQPATACGCASGLTNCNNICQQASGMVQWNNCYSFNYISDIPAEECKAMTWGEANTHCTNKGMRLPTLTELKCMCSWKNQNPLPGGYEQGWYWSSTAYDVYYEVVGFTASCLTAHGNVSLGNYVKCVKN